jgi:hypothetical protein
MPQADEITSRSGGMSFSAARIYAATSLVFDLQRVMIC